DSVSPRAPVRLIVERPAPSVRAVIVCAVSEAPLPLRFKVPPLSVRLLAVAPARRLTFPAVLSSVKLPPRLTVTLVVAAVTAPLKLRLLPVTTSGDVPLRLTAALAKVMPETDVLLITPFWRVSVPVPSELALVTARVPETPPALNMFTVMVPV